MKKSFKWLLCASVIAGAFMVGCDEEPVAPHEHEYATTYSSDANGHWYESICEHEETIKISLSTHRGMEDGICDDCGYDVHGGAGHTYATTLSKDETHHWYAATCGHSAAPLTKVEHVDNNNDKLCDEVGCGYDYNHTHEYNASMWDKDYVNHWHSATCGCAIEGADKAAHVDYDKDGVCEVCKYATFDPAQHAHTYKGGENPAKTDYDKDATNHWRVATCEHTGIDPIGLAAHDGMEDGECNTCGYDVHNGNGHTYSPDWSHDDTNHWHAANCGHNTEKSETEAHFDSNKDGECDRCGFDYNHEHTFSDQWSTSETEHWHAATCDNGCSVVVSKANHAGMSDGKCNTCGYVSTCEHTAASTWTTTETKHWKACADHPDAIHYDEGDHNGMVDGVCDTCGYKDSDEVEHTYAAEGEWTSDFNGHWLAGTCKHKDLVREGSFAAHVDELGAEGAEGSDGKCDTCGQILFTAEIGDKLMESMSWSKSGLFTHAYAAKDQDNVTMLTQEVDYYYEYGTDYLHVFNYVDGYKYWYHNYQNTLYAMSDTGTGSIAKMYIDPDLTEEDKLDYVLGYNFTFSGAEGSYGVEYTIANLYMYAVESENASNLFITKDGNTYKFTYDLLVDGDSADVKLLHKVSVEFTFDSYAHPVGYREYEYHNYISSFEFADVVYVATKAEDGSYFVADDADVVDFDIYTGTQNGGMPVAKSPFNLADVYASDFALTLDPNADPIVYLSENDPIKVQSGNMDGTDVYFMDVQSTTGDFAFDSLTLVNVDGSPYEGELVVTLSEDFKYFKINTGNAEIGTHVVKLKSMKAEKQITVEVTRPAVYMMLVSVRVNGEWKQSYDTMSVMEGETLEVNSYVNSNADARYTAEVLGGEDSDYVLTVPEDTASTNPYEINRGAASTVQFLKPGTYTVVISSIESTEENPFQDTLTVIVAKAPTVEELVSKAKVVYNLNCDEEIQETNNMSVVFAANAENVLTGTATIVITTTKGATTHEVAYTYSAETGFVLTKDGAEFTDATISYNAGKLKATFVGWDSMFVSPYDFSGTLVADYSNTDEAKVAQEYMSYETYNTLTLNADGTGTWKQDGGDGFDTFTFTCVDNGDGSFAITISGGKLVADGTYTLSEVDYGYMQVMAMTVPVNGQNDAFEY